MQFYLITLYSLLFFLPQILYADQNHLKKTIFTSWNSKPNFEDHKYQIKSDNSIGINVDYTNKYFDTKFVVKKNKNLIFDDSHITFNYKNVKLGLGKISRNWSFSPRTSLFLSENARPTDSIFLKIRNEKESRNKYLAWMPKSSIEIFNSKVKNTLTPNESILFGTRVIFSPSNSLDLEFIKISQLGEKSYRNTKNFILSPFLNTNEGPNADINSVAGIGLSYSVPENIMPIRSYFQLLGEDEANSLPSCFIYLLGLELTKPNRNAKARLGIEVVDTRTYFSTTGYCGPNSAYNNAFYNYTNYDKVLAAPIDTHGKSIELWGSSPLTKNTKINFSIKNLLINDAEMFGHRLSSSRQQGWSNYIGISWEKNNVSISSKLGYQNISLNNINISDGLNLNIISEIKF